MAFDVKRKAELFLVANLGSTFPDLSFYPSKGGDDDGGQTLPRPPFGAIWIEDADKTIGYEKTYLLGGNIVWISREGVTDVADQSDTVQQIYSAVMQIQSQTDNLHQLLVHGIDVATVNEFTDTDRQAHGDVISFTMGVSELD